MHEAKKFGLQFLNRRSRVRRPVNANVAIVTVGSILLIVKVKFSSKFYKMKILRLAKYGLERPSTIE